MATHKKRRLELAAALFAFFSLVILGTFLFHWLEDWTYAESFYFSVVTLTTVGYGDLTPTTAESRIAVAIFILIGVSVAISALSVIGAMALERRESKIESAIRQKVKSNLPVINKKS